MNDTVYEVIWWTAQMIKTVMYFFPFLFSYTKIHIFLRTFMLNLLFFYDDIPDVNSYIKQEVVLQFL
jgi:hypothetical protein